MRRALLLLVLPMALSAQSGAESLVVRSSATPCLTVRRAPEADAPTLACLVPGTVVTADSAVPFWRHVRLADGKRGWAAKKFLEEHGGTPGDTPAPPSPSGTIPDSAWLEIHIVDVGQGDGIWITTHDDGVQGNGRFDGRNIVIDGGPDASEAKNEFAKYVEAHAHHNARIDALIVTHPHNDHYPGARGILRHFEVCDYYDPDTPNGSDFDAFLGEVRGAKCNGAPIRMHRGRANLGTPNWGSELTVEWLWGGPIEPAGMGSGNTRVNNASLVMKLTYGTQSFLFMGDAEGKKRDDSPDVPRYAEKAMLADPATAAKLKATVLKVAHHGSESSSTTPFISAVDPEVLIVSSGRKAFSGTYLPDRSTLQRYCAHNPSLRIYRTDQDDEAEHRTTANDADGDHIVIRTNGKRTVVQAYENGHTVAAPASCVP